nr:kiSS-1 receptor-like [Procambarus clarkii]
MRKVAAIDISDAGDGVSDDLHCCCWRVCVGMTLLLESPGHIPPPEHNHTLPDLFTLTLSLLSHHHSPGRGVTTHHHPFTYPSLSQATDLTSSGDPNSRAYTRRTKPLLSNYINHNTNQTTVVNHAAVSAAGGHFFKNTKKAATIAAATRSPAAAATRSPATAAAARSAANIPFITTCLEQLATTFTTNDSLLAPHRTTNGSQVGSAPTTPTAAHPCNTSLAHEDPGAGGGVRGTDTFLFDRGDVRAALIALYTAVFITGFVGNLVVLVVMWVHPRMRSTTNFFLTNLAIADFCVTVFCVYQNLSQYLAQTWVFGDFLCKMYNFVNYLSYTASVMILVVNCVERYVAIMCPFRAKTLLSHRNLVVSLVVVWAGSGVYCCPRLLYFRAATHELPGARYTEVICLADRELYDSRTFDTINFVLLYVMPLSVMSLLYWRIGRYLWINGRQVEEARGRNSPHDAPCRSTPHDAAPCSMPPHDPPCCISALKDDMVKAQQQSGGGGSSSSHGCYSAMGRRRWRHTPDMPIGPYHTERLLRTWRKVVKLLVAVVLCFALCNLPFHLRKMLTYYHPGYDATTDAALLFTPLSNLLMYLNSALNPIVYSFMSHNFRACVRDVLTRYTRRGRRRHPSGPLFAPPHAHTPVSRHAHVIPPQPNTPINPQHHTTHTPPHSAHNTPRAPHNPHHTPP